MMSTVKNTIVGFVMGRLLKVLRVYYEFVLVLFHKNFCKIAKKKRYVLIIKHFFVLLHLVIAVKENKKAEKGDVKVP